MRGSTIAGLGLVLATIAAACGPLMPTSIAIPIGSPLTPKQPLMAEFDRNLATWQASGITRYAFTYTPSCFCPIEPHLVVSDGTAVRIDGVAVDGAVVPASGAPVGVDGLFAIVRQAIKGDRATIGYDESTGVPTAMDSDPIANAVDDAVSFKVTDWTLDPPDDRVLGTISGNRRLWDGQNLRTYTWSIKIACDCYHDGRRYDIKVNDGDPTVSSRGKRVAVEELEGVPLTIPAFFDVVAGWAVTAETKVAFNSERGYPTRADFHAMRPDTVQFETITVVSFAIP
jgi:hypothetical protein